MKIKSDFVTNSSSVAYIVCVPLWLELSLDDKLFKESCELHSEDDSLEENVRDAISLLEEMKIGGTFYADNMENHEAFFILRDYLSSNEYGLRLVNTESGRDSIEIITVEQVNKMFLSVNKDQFDSAFDFLKEEKNV